MSTEDRRPAVVGQVEPSVMQHTPGPWRFYTEPQPNGCPIVGARGLMVCMLAHTVNQQDQRDEALANAALIAAAPDLLNALRSVELVMREHGMTTHGVHAQVCAALKKAVCAA